jgi:hypothetical protein
MTDVPPFLTYPYKEGPISDTGTLGCSQRQTWSCSQVSQVSGSLAELAVSPPHRLASLSLYVQR